MLPSSRPLFWFVSFGMGWLCFLFLLACDPPPSSSLCSQDSDCLAGKICRQSRCEDAQKRCQTDKDCAVNESCQASYCKPSSPACQADRDCAQGQICLKQTCQMQFCSDDRNCLTGERCIAGACSKSTETTGESTTEGRPEGDGGTQDGPPSDGSPDALPEATKDNSPLVCTPKRDGRIERDELTFRLGSSVAYHALGSSASPIEVDLKGSVGPDGATLWDLSKAEPSQIREIDEILPIQGTWFEKDFPDPIPSYASVLDRVPPTGMKSIPLGVYRLTPDALQILGFVSQQKSEYSVSYKTYPEVLRFPMEVGTKWTSDVTSSGTFGFVTYNAGETYDFEVDAKGTLKIPLGNYPVLRLRLKFTQQIFLPTLYRTTRISYFFLSECVGIVAKVDSKAYETDPLFRQAARLRRLAD